MSSANSKRKEKDFRLREAERRNSLLAGITPTYEVRERQTIRYAYDPHLEPQLLWSRKAEHTSFEVPVASLYIHKRQSTVMEVKA